MEYLRGDQDCPLILSGENDVVLMWYIDAVFVVHPNMHWHTGGGLTMGRGFPIAVSTKRKLNTKSLIESELVGVDNMMPIILWTCYFLLEQGYGVIENLLLQDNRSSILLERNGRASSGKCTRHINIRYFSFRTKWIWRRSPLTGAQQSRWSLTIWQSHFKEVDSWILGITSWEELGVLNPITMWLRQSSRMAGPPTKSSPRRWARWQAGTVSS